MEPMFCKKAKPPTIMKSVPRSFQKAAFATPTRGLKQWEVPKELRKCCSDETVSSRVRGGSPWSNWLEHMWYTYSSSEHFENSLYLRKTRWRLQSNFDWRDKQTTSLGRLHTPRKQRLQHLMHKLYWFDLLWLSCTSNQRRIHCKSSQCPESRQWRLYQSLSRKF